MTVPIQAPALGADPYVFGEPITVISTSRDGVDGDGNDVFIDVESTTMIGAFNPGGSGRRGSGTAGTEYNIGRDTVLMQPTCYIPREVIPDGFTVSGTDSIVVRGIRFQVDGLPADWRNPYTGWAPGLELRLKTGTG